MSSGAICLHAVIQNGGVFSSELHIHQVDPRRKCPGTSRGTDTHVIGEIFYLKAKAEDTC